MDFTIIIMFQCLKMVMLQCVQFRTVASKAIGYNFQRVCFRLVEALCNVRYDADSSG